MLVTRAGLSPVMVGRGSELAQLQRLAAEASHPTIALIGGEPGIGKTRLASELVSAVPPETRRLLTQADPSATGQPYQLLLDLAGCPCSRAADDSRVTELAAALRAAGDPMGRPAAAVALLRALVGDDRVLVVVDDLHWADPESLALFDQLEEVTIGPLVLVGTYRPEELSRRHPLAALLERLDRRRGVTHLRLGRLTPTGTAAFLSAVYGRTPARRTVTALHHRTGGNPFFLEELLKAADGSGLDEIHQQPLPWNLAEALRSQLDGLGPQQRQVVEAAAVLGARVSFDLLSTVTGLAEPAMLGALRELIDCGLLVEVEDDQFGFRHTLTREAVAGEMLARQRRRLHEAALEALRSEPFPDLAAVAVHARGAGRLDDMIDAARRGAAERLSAGSAYAALLLAELALAEAPDDFELLALAGAAAWRAGYLADAQRHADRALRTTSDDAQRVAALTQLVRVAWQQGELAQMETYTEQVRALAQALPDGKVQAKAMVAVAQSYMMRGPQDAAIEWAERARASAERHDLKRVRLQALVEKGSALLAEPGTVASGRRLLREVAAEAEDAGYCLEATRGWHNLFWYLPPDDPDAPALLERVRANAERAGVAGLAQGGYHEGRAWLAMAEGDQAGALAVLEQAQRVDLHAMVIDPASSAPIPLFAGPSKDVKIRGRLAQLQLERGDLASAEALLPDGPATRRWRVALPGFRFQLACFRHDLATARELLAKLVAEVELPSWEAVHCQVSAGLAAGLAASELRALTAAASGQTGCSNSVDHPLYVLVEAQLAEAEQAYDSALAGYRQVTAARDPFAAPPFRGTAALGAARCLIQLGQVEEAHDRLAAAELALARWPGWRSAELATVQQRLRGNREPGLTGGPLTPREREVADLVAEGLTNAEIARRLVISRKTVAVHVSHILAKLEMSSRAQIAAWVARSRETLPV